MTIDGSKVEQDATELYLGAYHFDGNPDELLTGYRTMLSRFPLEALPLHVCVRRDDGLMVFDACPSRAAFDEFTASPGFRDAVLEAGLPQPRIEPLGEISVAHLLTEIR